MNCDEEIQTWLDAEIEWVKAELISEAKKQDRGEDGLSNFTPWPNSPGTWKHKKEQ